MQKIFYAADGSTKFTRVPFVRDAYQKNSKAQYTAFDREQYCTIGKIIVLSILHGGPVPIFFADPFIDYFFDKKKEFKGSCEDIPDVDIRGKVEKIL